MDAASQPAQAIAVISGRRAVGRTTLVANLSALLSSPARRVEIIEICAATEAGEGERPLPAEGPRSHAHPPEVCRNAPPEPRDLAPPAHPLDPRPGGCDLSLVDCPAGPDQAAVAAALSAARTLLVATPEPASVVRSYALLKLLVVRGLRQPVDLVVNLAASPAQGHAVAQRVRRAAERFLNLPVEPAGVIPVDPHVRRAARAGLLVSVRYPRCPAAAALELLARRLRGERECSLPRGGVWAHVAGLFL